jgi:peptidoglycan hydrolase CwlO-like protein
MRNKRVTYRTAGVEDQPPFLRDLITNSPEFNFNMNDIGRVREELKKLIQNLSSGYLEAKAKEDAEQDEKRRAKKRKLQTEAAAAKASADAKDDEETKGGEEKKSDEFIDEANDGRVDKDVDGAEV